jgi:DNA-binding LacI/PurR family transcriptional regulator
VRSAPVEVFRRAAREAGLAVRDFDAPERPLDAFTCLETLQEGPDAPTVVVARQGAAVQLMQAADEMHLIVPQDLSLVALRDRSQLPGGTRLPRSTVHLNPGKVAHVAAQAMMRRLAGEPLEADIVVEMASWIERATTGPAAWPPGVARAS